MLTVVHNKLAINILLFRLLTESFVCKCGQSNVFDGIATNCS